MMLLVLQFNCYYSSSSDDMYSPSLHQERVSPHLRLLVHLESEEENSSESLVILSATPPPFVPPPLYVFSSPTAGRRNLLIEAELLNAQR